MNPSGARPPAFGGQLKRPSAVRGPGARILGDQRREAAEAAAAAARANRRRLLHPDNEDDDAGYDAFADVSGGLFAEEEYNEEDKEADQIYASVEKRMDANRGAAREARIEAELKKYRKENPTIKQQFAESKQALGNISLDEWAAVPDIGDYSVKRRKLDKYTPAPDSILQHARNQEATSTSILPGNATDLAVIGAGRTSVLGHNLDRASNPQDGAKSIVPSTAVDATGYLTEMAGVHISSASEISDIKRARLLLKSVTTTNPTHGPGWIAAARLEEVAGRMSAARDLAGEGCRRCPTEEDVWLEAARLYPPARARKVLAQAVVYVPRSVKVWLQAAALETSDNKRKKRVLRKALEIIPRSARLWRAAVELEDTDGAKILLRRAVECVPDDVDLWLALAKLEPYEKAKVALSRARTALPTEPSIWVTAARLEEQSVGANSPLIAQLIRNAITSLSSRDDDNKTDNVDVIDNTGIIKRDRWLKEAKEADKTGFPATCEAIVQYSLHLGIDNELDKLDIWNEDADAAEREGYPTLARYIHAKITGSFPAHEGVWIRSAQFEKRTGNNENNCEKVLGKAVEYCAQVEVLWLMLAKEQWMNGGIEYARKTLDKALKVNGDSEAIWIAAAKIETESNNLKKARELLKHAREEALSARVVMKSALLERLLGNQREEVAFLDEGVEDFPNSPKLWLMLAQWHERNDKPLIKRDINAIEDEGTTGAADRNNMKDGGNAIKSVFLNANEVYEKGVRTCPDCIELWIGMGRLEETNGSSVTARAILERGTQKNKKNRDLDLLWRERVFLEVRVAQRHNGSINANSTCHTVLARALREGECGKSGKLWALSMAMAAPEDRKARTGDALRECGRDSIVILEAARLLWRDGKINKARKWLERSVQLDADFGDAWAALLSFEMQHGSAAQVKSAEDRAVEAEAAHGDRWCAVRKKVGNEKLTRLQVLRKVATIHPSEASITGVFDI